MLSFVKRFIVLLRNTSWLLCQEAVKRITRTKAKSIAEDVILITGGGRGIGKEIALQFALHKPKHIIVWGRQEGSLEETMNAVRRLGVNCSFMQVDLAHREQIYNAAQELKAKFGEVSVLVNNAGVVVGNTIIAAKSQDIEHTLSVNTLAHVWTLKAFLPDMLKKGTGHVVVISSVLGLLGMKGAGGYVTSKFASTGLAESLRQELLTSGKDIMVTSIHPYQVDNTMFAGMTTRVSWLIPPLSERYVAERTVDAVLYNRDQVLLPRIMYLLYFFNSVLPVGVLTVVNKALGVDKAMENVICKSPQSPPPPVTTTLTTPLHPL